MFTLGELLIIELAMLQYLKGLDLSLQCGQEIMEIVGKCERNIAKLRIAIAKLPPLDLGPDPSQKKTE